MIQLAVALSLVCAFLWFMNREVHRILVAFHVMNDHKIFILAIALLASGCAPRVFLNDGQIDQESGLIWTADHWEQGWWSKQFDAAKKQGCHLEDSCGIFPPYYIGAQYCGEPQTICPGEHWKAGQK